MENLGGFYGLIAGIVDTHNVWQMLGAYIVLELLLIESGYEIRELSEGVPYNLSRGSKYGDRALIICLLLGISILQRSGAVLPHYVNNIYNQVGTVGFAILVGIAWQMHDVSARAVNTVTDAAHNLIVVPIFVFLFLVMAPVFVYCGTPKECGMALLLVIFWAVMVCWDAKLGRLDQPGWFERRFPGMLGK